MSGAPPRWKTAVVVWLAIYPALTLVLALIGSAVQPWPLPLRTLVTTAVLVPLMVYVLIPTIQRLLAPWYRARKDLTNDLRLQLGFLGTTGFEPVTSGA